MLLRVAMNLNRSVFELCRVRATLDAFFVVLEKARLAKYNRLLEIEEELTAKF